MHHKNRKKRVKINTNRHSFTKQYRQECCCKPTQNRKCCHNKYSEYLELYRQLKKLNQGDPKKKKKKRFEPPALKIKKPICKCTSLKSKSTCPDLNPKLSTRTEFEKLHCPLEPLDCKSQTANRVRARKSVKTVFKRCSHASGVCKFGNEVCDIVLPSVTASIRHGSDESILNVGSPNTSGAVISAQLVSLSPSQHKTPVPDKKAFSLKRPRSGVFINESDNFVPDPDDVEDAILEIPYEEAKGRFRSRCRCPNIAGGQRRQRLAKLRRKLKNQLRRRTRRRRCRRRRRGGSWEDDIAVSIGKHGSRKPRYERSTQKHLRDDESICGNDDIPKPHHVRIPPHLKKGTLQTHSLTVVPCPASGKKATAFGLMTGSKNMYDSKYSATSRGKQALTICIMAYCLAFHYHPKQWTLKLIDSIVDSGDKWFLQLLEKVHDHAAVMGICEVLPFGRKEYLILNGKRMQVLLCEPEVVGYTMSRDPTVYNLCRALTLFFKEHRSGIFLTRILKLVIWKDKVCYYMFDPYGRDMRGLSNYKEGKAAIMAALNVDDLTDLVLSRTALEDQKFILSVIKVLKITEEDDDIESDQDMTPAERAMAEYRIITENYAIASANIHLGDKCFEAARYHQALTMAIVALTYSKISPPNTWYSKTLDKIMKMGNKLYLDCQNPDILLDLTIDNIPTEIQLGPYVCEIIIYRERVKGQLFTQKECLLNIKAGLNEFFKKPYSSGILQFNNYSLALWKQKDMYYIFDPYPRSPDGVKCLKGKGCNLMCLNTDIMAEMLEKNWNYLPATTQFVIHAFKVLKLRKNEKKDELVCTLSDNDLADHVPKHNVLQSGGDGPAISGGNRTRVPVIIPDTEKEIDEEHMGDIMSLIDSIQEEFVPDFHYKCKKSKLEETREEKAVNLDSPTVSVTQIVPPWPKPRDKTGEPEEPDPDPEPEPPPPVEPGEGHDEEGEGGEEEEDERSEAETEKPEEPPEESMVAPPPPSPLNEPEVEPPPPLETAENEAQTIKMEDIKRTVLPTADAVYRQRLKDMKEKMSAPLGEITVVMTPSKELAKQSNFVHVPDGSQVLRGSVSVDSGPISDILPFTSMMAIILSYKYTVNTWTKGLVNFTIETGRKLYNKKKEKFRHAPVHVLPKITVGSQAYHVTSIAVYNGACWQLEEVLERFFRRYDRGIVSFPEYSAAVFKRNGLYYLFDSSPCTAVGLRDIEDQGNAVFMRFVELHCLVKRILYNKHGGREYQNFAISKLVVRRLLKETRRTLAYTESPKGSATDITKPHKSPSATFKEEVTCIKEPSRGFKCIEGLWRIQGTTALKDRDVINNVEVKPCHFVCITAMLMLAIRPINQWDPLTIDGVMETGMEVYDKACRLTYAEKRTVKKIVLEDRQFTINIRKVRVINENPHPTLEQYLRGVLSRVKYVVVNYPSCSLLVYYNKDKYYLFDPYGPPPSEEVSQSPEESSESLIKEKLPMTGGWTRYDSLKDLLDRFANVIDCRYYDDPSFYTYEVTSIKKLGKKGAFNYLMSPMFQTERELLRYKKKRVRQKRLIIEKLAWTTTLIDGVVWTRNMPHNALGHDRGTMMTRWKDWDIELPNDLYSLWGTLHPRSEEFEYENQGKQILATNVVAIAMTYCYEITEWSPVVLDAIVYYGDQYHTQSASKIREMNHEMKLEDLNPKFDMYPYSFKFSSRRVTFGTVYSMHKDRFNLANALSFFFETEQFGMLISSVKNLSFGRIGCAYFMFDCQTFGMPVFAPRNGSSYILLCESLNRLIYCIVLTLNIKRMNVPFDIYSISLSLNEKS